MLVLCGVGVVVCWCCGGVGVVGCWCCAVLLWRVVVVVLLLWCCCCGVVFAVLLLFQTRRSMCVCANHMRMNWQVSAGLRRPRVVTLPQTPSEATLQATLGQRTKNCQVRRARGRNVQFPSATGSGKASEASSVHTSSFSVTRRPIHWRAGQETTSGSEFPFSKNWN